MRRAASASSACGVFSPAACRERFAHLLRCLLRAARDGGGGLALYLGGDAAARRAGHGVSAGEPHAQKGIFLAPRVFHGAASTVAGGAAPGMMPGAVVRSCI